MCELGTVPNEQRTCPKLADDAEGAGYDLDLEVRAPELLAVDLTGRLLGKVDRRMAEAPQENDLRQRVPAPAGQAKEREKVGDGGAPHVVAHVEQPISGVGVGTDLEAPSVGRAHLDGEDERREVDRILAVKARGAREALMRLGDHLEARGDEERLALLRRVGGAARGRVDGNRGVKPKGERLHEVDAVDASDLELARLSADELRKGPLDVVFRHPERAGIVVS